MKKLTFPITRANLGGYAGSTLGWFIIDADGLEAASSVMEHVADLAAFAVDGDPRGTIDVVIDDTDPAHLLLARDPLSAVPTADTTGSEPAAVVFYDTTGGSDATDKLVSLLQVPEIEPGGPGWEVDPADGIADITDQNNLSVATVPFVNGDVDAETLAEALDPFIGGSSGEILDFEPVLLNGWGSPVDLNGGYTYGRYQMLTESLCWFEAWVDINAGGTPATGTGPFIFLLPKPVKQDPPVGGRPVLRTVGDVVAVRGTPTSNTGKCRGAVTGGDLSTAFGAPPGTVAPQACIFDNVTSEIDEEAQSFGWTNGDGSGFPFAWCETNTFLKFTGTYEIEPD